MHGIIAALRRGVAERGRRQVLIVDEAQALPVASLEELRMLSNVTEGAHALLQVLLLGQPQLRHTLAGRISTSSASASSPPITSPP